MQRVRHNQQQTLLDFKYCLILTSRDNSSWLYSLLDQAVCESRQTALQKDQHKTCISACVLYHVIYDLDYSCFYDSCKFLRQKIFTV